MYVDVMSIKFGENQGFPRPLPKTKDMWHVIVFFQKHSYLVMVKFHSMAEKNEITPNNKSKHASHPKPQVYMKLLDLPTPFVFL